MLMLTPRRKPESFLSQEKSPLVKRPHRGGLSTPLGHFILRVSEGRGGMETCLSKSLKVEGRFKIWSWDCAEVRGDLWAGLSAAFWKRTRGSVCG